MRWMAMRARGALVMLCFACVGISIADVPVAANSATVAADRLGEGWWADRHKAILAMVEAHADPEVILIGDSITNNYDKSKLPDEDFQPTWQRFYAPRRALNLGFSGDTTANVLWRLEHGEVDGLHPKVALLLIGTNNTGFAGQTAEQTERGIDAVVGELEMRLPATKILLLGVLPSAISDAKTAADGAVNAYLATCYGENPRVTYLDLGAIFYKSAGELDASIFYDPRLPQHGKPLHPDTRGQERMAEAIEPTLAAMLGVEPLVPLASMMGADTAVVPVPRLEVDSYDWYARHHAEVALGLRVKPEVVLIGDSITHFWGGAPGAARVSGPAAWQLVFGVMPAINLGFGWDRTQNVLWRLRQGEFVGLTPKWVVINIGTNNLTGTSHARASTPEEIVAGVDAIVRKVQERSPSSKVIVMGIFPRGTEPTSPLRAPIVRTNALLAQRFGGDASVKYLDIGARFLSPDGSLPAAMMPDGTHPSEAGYGIWADALIKAGVRP